MASVVPSWVCSRGHDQGARQGSAGSHAAPRVRLSPEEIKLTARLKPIERRIAWILAALTAVGITVAELDVGVQPIRLGGGLASAVLLTWAARGRSRFMVGIAAMSAAFFWPVKNRGSWPIRRWFS